MMAKVLIKQEEEWNFECKVEIQVRGEHSQEKVEPHHHVTGIFFRSINSILLFTYLISFYVLLFIIAN